MSKVYVPIPPPLTWACPECKQEKDWYKKLSALCVQCKNCLSYFVVDGSEWKKAENVNGTIEPIKNKGGDNL